MGVEEQHPEGFVSCAAYNSRSEADAACARLAVDDIDAVVGGGEWEPALGDSAEVHGFHVLVAEQDCDDAISVLTGLDFADDSGYLRSQAPSRKRRVVGWYLMLQYVIPMAVAIVLGIVLLITLLI